MIDKADLDRYIRELDNPGEIGDEDRKKGYVGLYENMAMMKNLQKIMVEDTKEMMTKECLQDDFFRGMRYGMFIRTKSIFDKAKELYEEYQREKPIPLPK